MRSFGRVVDEVLRQSDIVLEVLDARFIDETRNTRIEKKAKILIQVINKCDYVEKNALDEAKKKFENCVFVSAIKHYGMTMLRQKIKDLARKHKIHNPKVGVVGYPNVGKSSLINAFKGKASARTSPEAGFTKGKQLLRIGNDFMMIDTPGVIQKGDDEFLVLKGAKNPYSIEDPDVAATKLIIEQKDFIKNVYHVDVEDPEKTLEDIAFKLHMKLKGGYPDTERAARKILYDWLTVSRNQPQRL